MAFIDKIKENPALVIAAVLAVLAFLGIIVWFYMALSAQMQALEAGVGTY